MAEEMVKVRLRGPNQDEVETLWATPVGADQYRVENSPFFAYGVSWEDVVEAHLDDDYLEFTRCITKSGNRTIRMIADFSEDNEQAQEFLKDLVDLGCSYEGMKCRLISVNVPPEVDLERVADFLTKPDWIKWEYADPTYEEIFGEE
jgi:hypothetical protein